MAAAARNGQSVRVNRCAGVYGIQTSPSTLYDLATLRIGTSRRRRAHTERGHSERDNVLCEPSGLPPADP
jgi:hypothetical protein